MGRNTPKANDPTHTEGSQARKKKPKHAMPELARSVPKLAMLKLARSHAEASPKGDGGWGENWPTLRSWAS